MNKSNLLQLTADVVRQLIRALVRFARPRIIPLLGAIVICLLVWELWTVFKDHREEKITFLAGPADSENREDARNIKETVKQNSRDLVGPNYSVHLENTSGFEENRKRVRDDTDGRLIGFAYDGFGDLENVSMVLPLDSRYLHILCRRSFYKECLDSYSAADDSGSPDSLTLKDILASVQPGRVYLGKSGSATRIMSETILKHFQKKPGRLQSFGIHGTQELRAALYNGDVDLAFTSSAISAGYLQQIAADDQCMLLGLGDDQAAIVQHNPHLLALPMAKNSYQSGEFCPHEIKTIGARRVIICSDAMSPRTVYNFANNARIALRDSLPSVDWDKNLLSQGRLYFEVHPGAESLLNDKPMPNGNLWWSTMQTTIGLWILAEILRGVSSMLSKTEKTKDEAETPAVQPVAATDSAFLALRNEIDERAKELKIVPVPLTEELRAEWFKKSESLRAKIREKQRLGEISRDRTLSLLEGVSELDLDLNMKPTNDQQRTKSEAALS